MSVSMPFIPGHPRKLLGPSRASTRVQRAATSTCRQTHPPRTGRNELPAWMGSTRGAVPTPSADQSSHFFPPGKSAKNPLKRFPSNFMRKRCETRILEMRATMRNWNVNDLLRTRCCTLSWVKTLKTSTETLMRNWNVGDLLHRRGGILSTEKTLKTSTSTTPSANWNVNRLLDRLPDDLDKRHDRRRYHQLFHRLRRTKDCASSAGWTHDLGHFDNPLGNREVERCEKVHQLFYHLRHNVVEQRC